MTDETGAAAPATEQAQPAPAETEQATSIAGVQPDAALENAETQGNQEQTEGDEGDRPKRRSTSERYRRKISAQAGVIERLAAEKEELERKLSSPKAEPDLPKPSDYPGGEYDPQYVADLAATKAEQKISAKLDDRDRKTAKERADDGARTALQEFEKRAEKVKTAVPDFDETLEAFVEDGGSFAPHVARRLHKAGEKGPMLAYHLAKNPELTDELNSMSAEDAAAEIARLEAKTSLPQPRTQTKAPAPLAGLKGGAAPSRDVHALAKSDDVSDFIKLRNEQERAKRAR